MSGLPVAGAFNILIHTWWHESPSTRIVQLICPGRLFRNGDAQFILNRVSYSFSLQLQASSLSHRYPSLPLFPHRTSLLVNSSKAMPCSKRRTLLFQRLELRRRVRHVTVGRQFPIDRNRSSPTTSLIYRLEIVPTKKAMLVCIYIVTKARFRKKKKVETTRQNTIT